MERKARPILGWAQTAAADRLLSVAAEATSAGLARPMPGLAPSPRGASWLTPLLGRGNGISRETTPRGAGDRPARPARRAMG